MINERVLSLMGASQSLVSRRMRSAVAEILEILDRHPSLIMGDDVYEVLRNLSDYCLSIADDNIDIVSEVTEEDKKVLLAYVNNLHEDPLYTLDMHSSNLKNVIQSWVAMGAALGLNKTTLLTNIMTYQDPRTFPGFSSLGVSFSGFNGKITPMKGMALTISTMTNEAYQYGTLQSFRRSGAIGYRVQRNSGYDCPLCDSLVGYIHPLDEICLPAHPNCVCSAVPVYSGEM